MPSLNSDRYLILNFWRRDQPYFSQESYDQKPTFFLAVWPPSPFTTVLFIRENVDNYGWPPSYLDLEIGTKIDAWLHVHLFSTKLTLVDRLHCCGQLWKWHIYTHTSALTLSEGLVNGVGSLTRGVGAVTHYMYSRTLDVDPSPPYPSVTCFSS